MRRRGKKAGNKWLRESDEEREGRDKKRKKERERRQEREERERKRQLKDNGGELGNMKLCRNEYVDEVG